MTRHFFYGGMMPSISLPMNFQDALLLDNEWHWDGTHYERTANTWLRNLDEKKIQILPILETVYGNGNANQWFHRWRLFFIACAELFGMENGTRWGVHHYRFNLAK
jgi:cyclopropane-fatty-acyl-phospholipid synthase